MQWIYTDYPLPEPPSPRETLAVLPVCPYGVVTVRWIFDDDGLVAEFFVAPAQYREQGAARGHGPYRDPRIGDRLARAFVLRAVHMALWRRVGDRHREQHEAPWAVVTITPWRRVSLAC